MEDLRRRLHDWDGTEEERRGIVRSYVERIEVKRSVRTGRGSLRPRAPDDHLAEVDGPMILYPLTGPRPTRCVRAQQLVPVE